jgi:hypothetical protein
MVLVPDQHAIAMFSFLYRGTEAELRPPGAKAYGPDPTADELRCERAASSP